MAFTNKEKNFLIAFVVVLVFVLWSILLYNYPPTEIVALIGVENGYLLTFLSALLGGTSVLFPFPYYLVVFTLGAGGLNPFLLGIASGIGLVLGDSTTYYLGYKGREIISGRIVGIFNKIHSWASQKPKWVMPTLLFFYGAFFPAPNDVIVIPLGLARYPYMKVVIPLVLGNIVFSTIVAFAGIYGWEWILSLT
ncbi:hypothetical protein HYT25_01055 [Candidatus Pacearchaeota archaeon]|nr:hypothetical protein [Candidatus Pacearchaeota archaeon]